MLRSRFLPFIVAAAFTAPAAIYFVANGGVKRTIASKLSETVSVTDFGATGNGTTDDRTAIVNAIANGGHVFFPPGSYLVGSSFTIPANTVLIGSGQAKTTILRGFTGDFITALNANVAIYDLTIDGQTGTYGTGRGILVPTSAGNQFFANVTVKNFVQSCLEFAQDGGSEFTSIGSTYYTTGAVGTVAAVKVAATDTQAIPKKFYATASNGCTLFDFGGTDHFWASGFYTNGLIFGATSFNVSIHEARFGALGGTITIQGDSHVISAISAATVSVKTTSSWIDIQSPSWAITEASPAANNSITITNPSWTTTWTATTTNPTLGNGTLTSRWSRKGVWVDVQVDLTIGSTTTLGTGTYEFSLPVADISTGAVQVCGSALLNNSGGTVGNLGVVRVQPGGTKVRIYYQNAGALALTTNAAPIAWATSDTIRFDCRYRVP